MKKFKQAHYDKVFGLSPEATWKDPTPEMLRDPVFEAIWQTIKTWDINVPNIYEGYCGANGNHVRAILEAVKSAK